MTKEQIAVIRERAEKASPGPWTLGKGSVTVREEAHPGWQGFIARTHIPGEIKRKEDSTLHANASFIAHARQDIPALLAYVEELELRLSKAVTDGNDIWVKLKNP